MGRPDDLAIEAVIDGGGDHEPHRSSLSSENRSSCQIRAVIQALGRRQHLLCRMLCSTFAVQNPAGRLQGNPRFLSDVTQRNTGFLC